MGEILLESGVPTVVLQAGVVLGAGSASFDMLRHLTERLPAMFGPKWLNNRTQPIAIDDVLHYLVAAADAPGDLNRTFDIGGPEVLSYRDMIKRYARVAGLGNRPVGVVPVLTPALASHWVGLVTPVAAGIARPLVGSLVHEAVASENDAPEVLGAPPGGPTGFDEAIRRATAGIDPTRWRRTVRTVGLATLACAGVGSLLTNPGSDWYRALRKPAWQPPPVAFPVVWTTLFAGIALAATTTITELAEVGRQEESDAVAGGLPREPGRQRRLERGLLPRAPSGRRHLRRRAAGAQRRRPRPARGAGGAGQGAGVRRVRRLEHVRDGLELGGGAATRARTGRDDQVVVGAPVGRAAGRVHARSSTSMCPLTATASPCPWVSSRSGRSSSRVRRPTSMIRHSSSASTTRSWRSRRQRIETMRAGASMIRRFAPRPCAGEGGSGARIAQRSFLGQRGLLASVSVARAVERSHTWRVASMLKVRSTTSETGHSIHRATAK